MTIPTKKLLSGCELPIFGFGTWEIGGKKQRVDNYDATQDIHAIKTAYALGITRFDTAQIYADGQSEEILGKALQDIDRSSYIISSKVDGTDLTYDGILRAAERSLTRLGMDYLDLYFIHWPMPDMDMKQVMAAFDRLKEEGIIKHIGVCNFGTESLKKAQAATSNPIVLNQVHYNLMFREPQQEGVLDYCQNNDIFIEAWRPVQQGNLCKAGIAQIDTLCKKYDKTPVQIAINWLTSQTNVITLAKTSNITHLQENIGAVKWTMDAADVQDLQDNFIIQLDRSNAVRLG